MISAEQITQHEARSQVEEPTRVRRHLAPVIVAALACAGSAVAFAAYFAPRELGPIEPVFSGLQRDALTATLLGLVGFVFAAGAMISLRGGRLFRNLPLLVTNLALTVGSATAASVGGFLWYAGAPGVGWQHTEMPALTDADLAEGMAARMQRATIAIAAPAEDGDFRSPGFGSGAVIAADTERAWVVTCSHVAIPWAAVGSWRDPADAHPLWIMFSDGRTAVGTVRWTARPPLDVALIEIAMADPPEPVEISPSTTDIVHRTPVRFVPNPLRAGWMIHEGRVVKRRIHKTPAGAYSLLHTTLPVRPGDSGSGLFDESGRIIGLNTWQIVNSVDEARAVSLPGEAMRVIVESIEAGRLDQIDEYLERRR